MADLSLPPLYHASTRTMDVCSDSMPPTPLSADLSIPYISFPFVTCTYPFLSSLGTYPFLSSLVHILSFRHLVHILSFRHLVHILSFRHLYISFPFVTWYISFPFVTCTYPFLSSLGRLPLWFLVACFFTGYLGVARRKEWPHFFRFHVATGMLLEILLEVVGIVYRWLPHGFYWGKIGMHFWVVIGFGSLHCA